MYDFLIYGSYGYTGDLICALAVQKGMKPLIAGRNETLLKAQSQKYGFDYEVVAMDEVPKLHALVQKVKVVLHCAGPFMYTSATMVEVCLQNQVHYLDITGEWSVFEAIAKKNQEALDANIMLLPGVGYDVVPSDCLALYVKQLLPDATKLEIVLNNKGSRMSRGTSLTMAEGLGEMSAMRKGGIIVPVRLAAFTKNLTIEGKNRMAMSIPWGDIATAWYSTGIPDIVTYITAAPNSIKWAKRSYYLRHFLRLSWVKNWYKKQIYKKGTPITEEMRQQSVSQIWAGVQNTKGESQSALLTMPDGYLLTAQTSLLITEKVLSGDWKAGFQTPAKCYGSELIMQIVGVKRTVL